MDIDKRIIELNSAKKLIENNVASIQQNMQIEQQQLSNLNKEYLILLGKIQAFEEIRKEEQETE
jgi:hypothetical protein